MNTKQEIETINPALNPAFSPNLYAYMKKRTTRYHTDVYRHDGGGLWVGELDPKLNIISGARLWEILGRGSKAKVQSWLIPRKEFTVVPDFWERYRALGRCLIDPDHRKAFLSDDSRWKAEGETRTCQWCGNFTQRLQRREEIVVHEEWVAS